MTCIKRSTYLEMPMINKKYTKNEVRKRLTVLIPKPANVFSFICASPSYMRFHFQGICTSVVWIDAWKMKDGSSLKIVFFFSGM